MKVSHPRHNCIIVLGMHRSGTSALARVINLLGAHMGTNLLPADEDNQKGFWEHAEVLNIHEQLLKELERVWDDIRPMPHNWWREKAAHSARTDLFNLLKRDFENSRLWAVKEPRMCRLLKLWRPVLSELEVRPHFVIVFRNPLEVAASLAKRDGIPTTKSLLLWLLHTLESEIDTRDFPRAFISMEQLMDDWQTTMQRVSQILEIEWAADYDEVRHDVEKFLDPRLKHHNLSPCLLEDDSNVPAPVAEIYRLLMDTALGQQPLNVDSFSSVSEGLRREMAQFLPMAFLEDFDAQFRFRLDLEDRLQHTLAELWATQSDLLKAQARLDSMLSSRSWKLTAPLRKGYDAWWGFRRKWL